MATYRRQIRDIQANMRAGEGNKDRQQQRIEYLQGMREQRQEQRQNFPSSGRAQENPTAGMPMNPNGFQQRPMNPTAGMPMNPGGFQQAPMGAPRPMGQMQGGWSGEAYRPLPGNPQGSLGGAAQPGTMTPDAYQQAMAQAQQGMQQKGPWMSRYGPGQADPLAGIGSGQGNITQGRVGFGGGTQYPRAGMPMNPYGFQQSPYGPLQVAPPPGLPMPGQPGQQQPYIDPMQNARNPTPYPFRGRPQPLQARPGVGILSRPPQQYPR